MTSFPEEPTPRRTSSDIALLDRKTVLSDGTRMKMGAAQSTTAATTSGQSGNLRFCRRAWFSIRTAWTAGLVAACGGGASAHTLYVVTCNQTYAETVDDGSIEFTFCQSDDLYCDPTVAVETPLDSDFDVVGGTVSITVSLGYTPTTMKISTPSTDGWCISSVMWDDEQGADLLGLDAFLFLDIQSGADGWGCGDNGLLHDGTATCSSSWVFFNLDGSSNEYKVGVEACAGTSSASVLAYFCSDVTCDGTIGEEVEVLLTMSDDEGGWTHTYFSSEFNPVAVRLVKVENQDVIWCAEMVSYNFFTVVEGISTDDFEIDEGGEASKIVANIQHNGYSTPAPVVHTLAPVSVIQEAPTAAVAADSSSEWKWLDATWEIVVTVIATVVVAGGSVLLKWWMSRSSAVQRWISRGNSSSSS